MNVLLVLEQCAVERRNEFLRIIAAQRLGRYILGEQQLDPVEKLGSGRLFLQAGRLAQLEEGRERVAQQVAFQARKMHVDDTRHRGLVRKADVVKEAAPQEGIRQLLLVVRRDDDDGAVPG